MLIRKILVVIGAVFMMALLARSPVTWAGNFTDNGNETATDSNTGLMWQKEDDNTTRQWEAAISYCESLALAGYTDWRLPNIKELDSIMNDTSDPMIDPVFFPNTKEGYYWSSTSTPPSPVEPICVNGKWGNYQSSGTYSSSYYARCVRGGQAVTDIDGNVYNTVTIGTQVWLKEHLKVTKYRNGDAIGTTSPATLNITAETSPKYQWAYNGVESNVATYGYGRLYTWYAATDSRGVCPTGWHLPTDAEWTTLTSYLGGEAVAGGKMKEVGTTHWNSPNTGADNSSGFTALPGGYRNGNGFGYLGDDGYWWSSTESNATSAWYRDLAYYSGYVYPNFISKYYGFSVRCVRN